MAGLLFLLFRASFSGEMDHRNSFKRDAFPYRTSITKNLPKQKDIHQKFFKRKAEKASVAQIVSSGRYNAVDQKKIQIDYHNFLENNKPDIPRPTSNPFTTVGQITITAGSLISTTVATISEIQTTIETNTTVGVFTQVSKFTETFTETDNTYKLTISLVNEVIPTFTSFDKRTETTVFTRVYTIGQIVVTAHTKTNSLTEYLTYSRTSTNSVISQSPHSFATQFGVTETSFNAGTETSVYTRVSETYVWTASKGILTYMITKPLTWTKTSVEANKKVTITGSSQIKTNAYEAKDVWVDYTDILVNRSFPSPTEIPKAVSVDYEEKEVIFTFTHSEMSTEKASFSATECSTKGVVPTWTMTSMYTSTFAPKGDKQELTLTKAEVFAKVLTEIEENAKCYSMTIEKIQTVTNAITTTTGIITLTETMTNTKSIYYEVVEADTKYTWSSTKTRASPDDEFSVATMTDSRVYVSSGSIKTFVETYTTTVIHTTIPGYTTTLLYSTITTDYYSTYSASEKETDIVTLTLVRGNNHQSQIISSHSDCSNFYSNQMTNISSTVIYTYSEYFTLVNFKNTGSQSTTLYRLGKSTSYEIISVNIIGSTTNTNVLTITSIPESTVISPSSTITNSLISTYIYTAVFVNNTTLFSVFEDHCVFKDFTNTETYSKFPTITESNYYTVIETKISNMDLTQTSIPSVYTLHTYGYTILDETPTYILADFSYYTMMSTIIQAGDTSTGILSTSSVNAKTATGISTFSKTIIEYIPIRTPFPTFSEELINPYYTMANLTFTTVKEVPIISSTIYQRPTNYTTSTLTNIMTSTVLFTETFYSSGNTITFGYSTMNVLVPTEVNIKSKTKTIFLTYHSIGTNYLTATHHVTETLTQALTFHAEKLEASKEVNVSSYTEVVTSLCYQSFEVSSPTSAYVYTQIYQTWLWTKIEESVVYTVTTFSDYVYTKVSGKGATAYVATYSCVGSTSYYSNTESLSKVQELTTYTSIEYPVPSPIPTEEKIDKEVIKTYIATNTYASSVNTYMTTLSKVKCTEDIMTVTLTDTVTFKKTFTQSEKVITEMYTQASTIAYTLTQILANGDGCNTYVISKVTTGTQVFTNTEVAVKEHDMFKESVTSITVPYMKASKVMKKSTLTNSMIVLTVGASSKVTTYAYSDISTFVQVSDLMTYVETYTRTPVTTELSGPTSALVLTEKETEAYPEYSPINGLSEAFSMIYTQKPPQEMEIPRVQNPCMSFGTKQSVTNLQTYIETFSEYFILVTFKNTGNFTTTVTNIGTIAESAFTMAAFFSTTTVVSTSTVVKQGNSAVVNPSSVITNSISSTFTLTQVYVNSPTAYTEFKDICVVYGITMKDTTIMMPVEVQTQIPTLTDTNVAVTRPTDIEYITHIKQWEYREGLTMFGKTPTRTFSLFDTFTYTSEFFSDDFAKVKSLTYSEGKTVIENAVKTNTIVIAEPPKGDPDDNLIYIIIGVVIGAIVIAAIIVAVLLVVRKKDYFINEFDEYVLEEKYNKEYNTIMVSLYTDNNDTNEIIV